MFDFLKKKTNNNIYAPVNGTCLDITECNDKMFSSGLMGDGFMIEPTEKVVCSPCGGELTMVSSTKHAFGLKMSNGNEILVHIGIDTVNLKGNHFELLSSVNKRVKKGTPIMKCDIDDIKELGYDTSVLVIVVGKEELYKKHLHEVVNTGDIIIEG